MTEPSVYCFQCVRSCCSCSPRAADFTPSATAMVVAATWARRSDDSPATSDLYGVPPGSRSGDDRGRRRAAPCLLVGVENLQQRRLGRRPRRALSASPAAAPTQCTTLRGQGLIGRSRWPSPACSAGHRRRHHRRPLLRRSGDRHRQMVEAERRQVYGLAAARGVLDPQTRKASPVIAVACGMSGNPSTIREIDAVDANGASATGGLPWCIQGTGCTLARLSLGIYERRGDARSACALLRARLRDDGAAWDVDPWAAPPTKTQYIGTYAEPLGSIYSVVANGKARLAWLDNTPIGGAVEWAIDSGTRAVGLGGPVKCTSDCDDDPARRARSDDAERLFRAVRRRDGVDAARWCASRLRARLHPDPRRRDVRRRNRGCRASASCSMRRRQRGAWS